MRTIIEEHNFRKQLEKRGVSSKRLDELLEAIIFTVSRMPEQFPSVKGKKLHRIVVNPFLSKRLNLWFTYDDTTVTFLEVDEAE